MLIGNFLLEMIQGITSFIFRHMFCNTLYTMTANKLYIPIYLLELWTELKFAFS